MLRGPPVDRPGALFAYGSNERPDPPDETGRESASMNDPPLSGLEILDFTLIEEQSEG